MESAKKVEILSKQVLSFETYLQLEQESEFRHEFNDGQLIPVEAMTKVHNRIKRNITTLEKLEDVLLIPSLDLEVALKDIYRNIEV